MTSPPFAPNAVVAGKYRLRRLLAAGGMADVWVARNEATRADVALKVLRRDGPEDERERLRQEARLSAMLSHRSIVRVFDLLEEPDGTLVLVLELLRGETLAAYLSRSGARPGVEAVALLVPILGALAHAHARGIVHRDVSPANIFLTVDPDGHVAPKLVDFGIAKRSATSDGDEPPVQTVDGDVLGTPRYMAPERIRGAKDVDGRADVFSVGVVLLEAMTGVSPFAAETTAASLAAVLEQPVDSDPAIDPRLWLEIRRAIAKPPYERHATADELAAALRAALGKSDEAIEAALQATKPVVSEPRSLVVAGADAIPTARPRPVRRALVMALVGVSALLLAFAVVALARAKSSGSASIAPAPSSTLPADVPIHPPSSHAMPEPTTAPSAAPASLSRSHPIAPHPRPVATTPGF